MALDSINKGQIFRFLLKPCSTETFLAAMQDGLRQNELILSERNLLNKTLSGSIKVMVDILAMLKPEIFVQAGRLRNLARDLAETLYLEVQSWELELAALLSQIGTVTIPNNILESWQKGEKLDDAEINMIQSIPRMGKILINNIPRLQNIAEAVSYQNCPYDAPAGSGLPRAENIPLMARVLKIIVDFDVQFQKSHNPTGVFQNMFSHASEYDPRILPAFRLMVLRSLIQFSYPVSIHKLLSEETEYNPELWTEFRQVEPQVDDSIPFYKVSSALQGEKEMVVDGIRAGMVLSRDVCDKYGNLIVTKNTIITEVLMYKLINYFHFQDISGPIYIESAT